jgi:translation initiation factor 3 subunit F
VIGTLLGTRTDADTVEVHTAFAMLHSETSEQVAVDAEYLKVMYDLCHKVNPQEVIVGWSVSWSRLPWPACSFEGD